MRLLVVDDNVRLAELVAERLAVRGYSPDVANGVEAAEHALTAATYDLVVLDLGMPDGDGLVWLRDVRRRGFQMPVLLLTARGALHDRVAGLDAGADDYLVKPFEIDELAARLRALLRRPGSRDGPLLKVGGLEFDVAARAASLNQRPLELTRREADLLELMMRRAGTVVPRAVIDDTLYSFDDSFTPNAVEAIVSRLRRRMETLGETELLRTVRGVGYLLVETP